MKVTLISCTPNPVDAMAFSAATCYESEPSDKIVKHCIESGHESITEFALFHFLIEDCSRIASQQFTRHRLASFAQKSQRYVDESNFEYIIPDSIMNNSEALAAFNSVICESKKAYAELAAIGIPTDDVRQVLTNATETRFNMAMNFRELMHFCDFRLCSRASDEIREAATQMRNLVGEISPFLSSYLMPKCQRLGYCPEKKGCCGRMPTKKAVLDIYRYWERCGKPKFWEGINELS